MRWWGVVLDGRGGARVKKKKKKKNAALHSSVIISLFGEHYFYLGVRINSWRLRSGMQR